MDPVQDSASLRVRQQFLLESQNADGGWGFFARSQQSQSWLEPTAYAILALTGLPEAKTATSKAVDLVCSWQNPEGAFQPSATVKKTSWVTSLGTTVATTYGRTEAASRGAKYLLAVHGVEADSWLTKTVKIVLPPVYLDRDPFIPGWPWQEHCSSWIEPTSHAIIALQKTALQTSSSQKARERIDMGQQMILSLRCKDGGWNYGSRSAFNVDLPSYPETTALALFGLKGRSAAELAGPLDTLKKLAAQPQAPLARAWINVSLALHGLTPVALNPDLNGNDISLAALEALGAKSATTLFGGQTS